MTTRSRKKKRGEGTIVVDAIIAGEFPLDQKMNDPERTAALLNWAADKYPRQCIQYHYILQAIRGFSATPSLGSKDVTLLRRRMGRVKEILLMTYNRTTIAVTGSGVRASVDDLDAGEKPLVTAVKRYDSAANGVKKICGIIDEHKLPPGPAGDAVRRVMAGPVKQILTSHRKIVEQLKLLAAKPEEKKPEEKK